MKRFTKALVMLCVFVLAYMILLNHDFNVYAEDACAGPYTIEFTQESIDIEVNGIEPNYEELFTIKDSCGNDVKDVVNYHTVNSVDISVVNDYAFVVVITDGVDVYTEKLSVYVKEDITDPNLDVDFPVFIFTKNQELTDDLFLTHASAEDDKSGDLTNRITIDYSQVDVTTVGSYDAVFKVVDNSLNEATQTVTVKILEEEPELLSGIELPRHRVQRQMPNLLRNAVIFTLEGEEASIEIDSTTVNLNQVGIYDIYYTATLYNLTQTKMVQLHVVDLEAPVITATKMIKITEGSYFNPYKYVSVRDNYDEEEDIEVNIRGYYTNQKPGKYILTAIAKDQSGNESVYLISLIVEKEEGHIVLWTTLILGFVTVGASGALYYIRKKRG